MSATAGDIDRAAIARADMVEAQGWAAMFPVAPPALGLKVVRFGEATGLIAPALPLGMFNRVIGLGATREAGAEAIDEVVLTYRAAGASKVWIHTTPVTAPALEPMLIAKGFRAAQPKSWAKLAYPEERPLPTPPTALTVDKAGAADADDLGAVLIAAHGMPPALKSWVMAMVGHPAWRAYAARDGGRVVAGAFLHAESDGGWLGLGGTSPDARNRGAHSALLARRLADARAAGARTIVSETWEPEPGGRNPSLDNMKRLGFHVLYSRANWELPLA